jgi:hypothetical protein
MNAAITLILNTTMTMPTLKPVPLLRPFLPLFLAFATALLSAGAAWGQDKDRYTKAANQLGDLIKAGDYAGIQGKFNPAMAAALPLDKSTAFFKGLTQQVGKFQQLGEPRAAGAAMVYPAEFEKGTLDLQLTLDGRGQIAGLSFKPAAAAKKPGPQTDRYVKAANQLKELINAGDYAGIQGKFNAEMSAALPLDKSTEFFKGLTQQMGRIQQLGKPQLVGEAMVFAAEFEKETLDMQLTLDHRGSIAGLAFAPRAKP